MKLTSIEDAAIRDVKIIRFAHFPDDRGYFSEPFRKSDILNAANIGSIAGEEVLQINESVSKKGVLRGLHFQWNPYMGKLVRTIAGTMIDMFLDIRKGSPNFGKIGMHRMPAMDDSGEWIWVPPGFAHGCLFLENSKIEYLCTGEYSPGCEAGISPLSSEIDWSLCNIALKSELDSLVEEGLILSEKDRAGLSLTEWTNDERSENFVYGEC